MGLCIYPADYALLLKLNTNTVNINILKHLEAEFKFFPVLLDFILICQINVINWIC